MFTRARLLTLGGLLALALLVLTMVGDSRQPAQAQPAAGPAPVGRFQLSSFSYSWGNGSTCGAYILDTHTGEVFQVVGKNAPESIGVVGRAVPKQ